MVYAPSRAKIPDKICIVEKRFQWSPDSLGTDPLRVSFDSKIHSPPKNTIMIATNEFSGPFTIGELIQTNSGFYTNMIIENAIQSKLLPTIQAEIRHWAVNDMIMEGLVGKNGKIADDTKFVVAVYGQYSSLIAKDGPVYKKIMGL